MEKYILSEIFTLIPKEIYTKEMGVEALRDQFSIEGDRRCLEHECAGLPVVAVYAADNNISSEDGSEPLPLVVRLMDEREKIHNYNKVIFHYSNEKGIAHVVIFTGEDLKLANSFKSDSFESALYFMFLSIKQLQMNPRQCTIRVCSGISDKEEETVARFFNGVEKNNLDNLILK